MKHVQVSPGGDIDYGKAAMLADAAVGEDREIAAPMLMAWYDRKAERMSPAIAGADLRTRWQDYGASHGGQLEVDVGADYAFIYADSRDYEPYGPSPYVNLHDSEGHEFLCQLNKLGDRHHPTEDADACTPIDEWTSKLT